VDRQLRLVAAGAFGSRQDGRGRLNRDDLQVVPLATSLQPSSALSATTVSPAGGADAIAQNSITRTLLPL
jgi:hypothetical protein